VTRTIIAEIDSCPDDKATFQSLQTTLKVMLAGKTFLFVLDDVWEERRDMWEDFLKPFRYGNNGSKILLTTRSENVASVFANTNLHYPLSLLSEEDTWGLLHNKYNEEDWENILESKIWELSENDSKIVPALRVSYHYLPSNIKRCFVYCSFYPEDYEFDKDELILLWMAEGLLQPKGNNTLEKIGCAYFDELVARSFFQSSNTNRELFVMHDLMHDLATFFAGKFYFKLKQFDDRHRIDSKIRHLSYATKDEDTVKLSREAYNGALHMRTILDFASPRYNQSIDIESDSWHLQVSGCLRVLSFKHLFTKSLFDSICELIHLRYVNLSNSPIVTLSESICKLYNLQTLKLRNCAKLEMLPNGLQDLVNLHHLDIRGSSRLIEMPKGMGKLNHLNFLSDYIVGEQEDNGIRELATLEDLHGSFCISKLENVKNSGEALEAKMDNKKHINTLKLKWLPDGDIDDVQTERDILEKLQPHQKLKELSIEGYRGETFPDWLGLSRYSSMTKLSLKFCMNCCELPSLGQLPSLRHLELFEVDGLEKIDLEFYNKNNGSFQREIPFKSLETMTIKNMCRWREWHFPDEFDGFPQLRILEIINCPALSGDLPTHLPALEKLTIFGCEEVACSMPRVPKLDQFYVKCGSKCGMSFIDVAEYEVVISCTHVVKSIFECVSHIPPPLVQRLRFRGCCSAISISADYLPASLQYLNIWKCSKLTFSEQLQHNSLTEIYVGECDVAET
ncbi:hypothetical protein PIB30_105528, partial [Stylosanthes scabra]|nr:hypothetical protein [Stylosanthes scabra]